MEVPAGELQWIIIVACCSLHFNTNWISNDGDIFYYGLLPGFQCDALRLVQHPDVYLSMGQLTSAWLTRRPP